MIKPIGLFALPLMLALTMSPSTFAQEKSNDLSNSATVVPTELSIDNAEGVPETLSNDVQGAFASTPEPTPSSETSAATAAPEAVIPESTEGGELSEEAPQELSFFGKIWDYLTSHAESATSKAMLMAKKMEVKSKYGDEAVSEPTFSTILAMEEGIAEGDEVRAQRELDELVRQQEAQRLYEESLLCLALNGYHEARSETADQEVATAAVVLNRLSVGYRGATTICEVIYTPKQFSWVEQHGVHIPDTTNKIEKQAWERSLLIARRMLDPDATFIDPSNGALYYYNPSLVDWRYKHAYRQVAVLGSHRFMTEKDPSHPHYIDNSVVRINPVLFNGLTHDERDALIKQFQAEVK